MLLDNFTNEPEYLAYPNLWDGKLVSYCPSVTASGLTVYDYGPYGYHGTVTGATSANAWASSNGQTAYNSNATSDYVDCGTGLNTLVNGLSSATLSCWVNRPSGSATCAIGSFGPSTTRYGLLWQSTQLYGVAENGSGTGYINFLETRTGWHHYVMLLKSSSLFAYIDGVLISPVTVVGTPSTIAPTGSFSIGRYQPTPSYNASGTLTDDVAVWNRALTADEIRQLYYLGRGGSYAVDIPSVYRQPTASTGNRRRRIICTGAV